jgi:hypothetical protein
MSISKAIQVIVEQTYKLRHQYNAEINRQRQTTLWILDRTAFSVVKRKLIQYTLKLSIQEWSATKRIADNIEEGNKEEFKFDPDKGCTFGCELSARYSLPYRHWMYASVVEECLLPLSLFYPCWLFDRPAVFHNRWVIA